MSYRIAKPLKSWTLPLCALVTLLLSACTPQTQVVYKDRIVKEPVPTFVPLRSELTADCQPYAALPAAGKLTILDLMNRLDAVELSLSTCREELTDIRALQPTPPVTP